MHERRINPRVREENRVAVTVLAAELAPDLVDHTFFCPTADISRTGLRLCVHHPVPIGATLALRIAFHKPLRAFKHEGRVAWVRRDGDFDGYPCALGIELTRLQEGSESLWLRMLERKEADASELSS